MLIQREGEKEDGTELVRVEVEHGEHVGVDELFGCVVEGEHSITWLKVGDELVLTVGKGNESIGSETALIA